MPVPYRTSFNGKLDRLSSLIDRLRVHVSNALVDEDGPAPTESLPANLCVYRSSTDDLRLAFSPVRNGRARHFPDMMQKDGETLLVGARIGISGIGGQLVNALPDCLSVCLTSDPNLKAVVAPLVEEATEPRCGGQAVFHRLCEVVVIRLLRHAIEEGNVETGLLNGLSHPRIAAALVAIHEAPGESWTLERLAETAGMSRTQFAVTFKELVGSTPMGYLSGWRLEIARAELQSGRQVKSVASMCGFASAAAFSRAYSRRFGHPPKQKRQTAA